MLRKIVLGFLMFTLLISKSIAVCSIPDTCKYCRCYCDNDTLQRTPPYLFIGTGGNNPQKQIIANNYHKNNKIICEGESAEASSSELDDYGLCSSAACLGNAEKIAKALAEIQKMYDVADSKQREIDLAIAEKNRQAKGGADDMSSENFSVSTTQLLGDNKLKNIDGNAKKTLNTTLGTVIQKLMIALGSISLLIMTIGAGYMITYSGHDELLSKGKSIFNAGIISLVVSLLSYYLVSLLRFILYS